VLPSSLSSKLAIYKSLALIEEEVSRIIASSSSFKNPGRVIFGYTVSRIYETGKLGFLLHNRAIAASTCFY
jgi:hypothetical protein